MQLVSNYQQSAIGYTVGVYGTAIVYPFVRYGCIVAKL